MGKYIDAEKLKARIEKWLTYDNSIDTAFYIGRRDAERNILDLINSLQQEQPNKSFCEENCKGYRETGGKCFFGFNCPAMKEYEQPEVDLEAEIERYENEVHGFDSMSSSDCRNIARHFYELGLNARKEG